jgi:hypothetical protein
VEERYITVPMKVQLDGFTISLTTPEPDAMQMSIPRGSRAENCLNKLLRAGGKPHLDRAAPGGIWFPVDRM